MNIMRRAFGVIDDPMRGFMQRQQEGIRQSRQDAQIADLQARLGAQTPDYKDVLDSLESYAGRGGFDRASAEPVLRGGTPEQRDMMLRSVVNQSGPMSYGPLRYGWRESLTGMLGGTGTRNRIGQVGFYSGAAGAAGLGMTAAAQELMALMEYMQQGQQAAVQRDQELTS